MKATRKLVAMLGGALLTTGLFAAPSVEITAVQQQYPWKNTVDITYEVQGVTNMEYFVRFTPTTSDDKEILDVNGEPSIQVALTNNGTYVAQWYPQTNLQYTACKMTPAIFRGGSGGGDDYMIVDLDDWTVTYEPMATQEASNQRYNTDEYKTKKLVLRKIPADTYTIGESGYARNSPHETTMDNDYYITIFHVTEGQYARLTGGSSSSILPQRSVSWNTIRGNALVAATISSGPLKTLSDRTGLSFDLPTESMLFVAARANETGKYLSGNSTSSLADYVWYSGNSGSVPQGVGLKLPNGWGIYDACGNVWDFTRDAFSEGDLANFQPNGQKPITAGGTTVPYILGCCNVGLGELSLSNRSQSAKNSTRADTGFRLSVIMGDK